jgi:hypothetical protein
MARRTGSDTGKQFRPESEKPNATPFREGTAFGFLKTEVVLMDPGQSWFQIKVLIDYRFLLVFFAFIKWLFHRP